MEQEWELRSKAGCGLSPPPPWDYSPLGVWWQTRTLLGQNVLLLFPYFMLHVLVWGEQMCSGGVDQVLGRAKQSAARWPGRRGGVSECGIVSPPHQGPRRHVERMQPSASAWMARQSRAQPHIWPGRRLLHYTPSDSPFQPGSRGLSSQAFWLRRLGVSSPGGRGGGCPVSPASIPQPFLLPSAASALSMACTLTALPAPGLPSTEGRHLPLSRSRFYKSWLLQSGFHPGLALQSELGGAIWMNGWSHLSWEGSAVGNGREPGAPAALCDPGLLTVRLWASLPMRFQGDRSCLDEPAQLAHRLMRRCLLAPCLSLCGPWKWVSTSPWSLLAMQNLGPHPDPLNQNLSHLLMIHMSIQVWFYWAEVCPGHLQSAPRWIKGAGAMLCASSGWWSWVPHASKCTQRPVRHRNESGRLGSGHGTPGVCDGDYTGCRWAVARGIGTSGYCHCARMHKQISPKYSSLYDMPSDFLKQYISNWRIIALQCCVGFCHTSTWISHRYT